MRTFLLTLVALTWGSTFSLNLACMKWLHARNVASPNQSILGIRTIPTYLGYRLSPSSETRLYGSASDDSELEPEVVAPHEELRKELKGTNLFIVGMMGSGKSTVGEQLAKDLGYRFIDTDEVCEYMIEMPISDFFAQGKEKEFRQVEHQTLMELAQYTRTIVSTGGGVVENVENWGLLHHGIVVFLDTSTNDIYNRLNAKPEEVAKRPLLQTEDPLATLNELRDKRLNMYQKADLTIPIDGDDSVEQVSSSVLDGIMDFIKSNPPKWKQWKEKQQMMSGGPSKGFGGS